MTNRQLLEFADSEWGFGLYHSGHTKQLEASQDVNGGYAFKCSCGARGFFSRSLADRYFTMIYLRRNMA